MKSLYMPIRIAKNKTLKMPVQSHSNSLSLLLRRQMVQLLWKTEFLIK